MKIFQLSDEAHDLSEQFIVGHDCSISSTISGKISYEFHENGIGLVVFVKCSCGADEDLTEYHLW